MLNYLRGANSSRLRAMRQMHKSKKSAQIEDWYNLHMLIKPSIPALLDPAQLDTFAKQGYVIVDDFMPREITALLAQEAISRLRNQDMISARTGKKTLLNQSIRGDHIDWVEETDSNIAIQAYFAQMHELQRLFNEQFFMGLQSLETHLAVYPVGTGYQKHLDQFQLDHSTQINTRQVSSILYLNDDWSQAYGGELRLYIDASAYLDILPVAGRLVLFLSSQFWHEVLPATRERLSLTGWFRTRETQLL